MLVVVAACGGSDDASNPTDAPDPAGLVLAVPKEVYESFVASASAPEQTEGVAFFIDAEVEPRCTDLAPPFRCLIHLPPDGPAGSVTVTARAATAPDATMTTTRVLPAREACMDPLATCVNSWTTAGTAAGYGGLTYENRDGEHAVVDRSEMPGLTYVTHNNGNSTWGVTGPSADPAAIVLANQSQAYTTVGYSLLRYDLTMIREFARYETLYTQSKWRLYPEHTDCGVEDMFPFMTPVWLASQGSSGSELDEGRRLLLALGALSPAVRASLHADGALTSAMTAIHRRARVASDAEYLTGVAHPTAFGNLDAERATVEAAHALTADHLPPVAALAVTADEFGVPDELITGSTTVARVFSSGGAETRRITVDASGSRALDQKPVTYHWRVLRGDPSLVTITPTAPDESTVEITFSRHPSVTYESLGSSSGTLIPHRSNLTVVGLFVHNGHLFSPPAFVTSFTADPRRGAPGDNNLD